MIFSLYRLDDDDSDDFVTPPPPKKRVTFTMEENGLMERHFDVHNNNTVPSRPACEEFLKEYQMDKEWQSVQDKVKTFHRL